MTEDSTVVKGIWANLEQRETGRIIQTPSFSAKLSKRTVTDCERGVFEVKGTVNYSGKNTALSLMRDVEKRGHFPLLAGEIKRGRCVCRPLQVMAIRLGSLVKSCRPASGPGLATSPSLDIFFILTLYGGLTSQKSHIHTQSKKGRFLFLKLFFTAVKIRFWRFKNKCFPQTFPQKKAKLCFYLLGFFPLQVLPGCGGRGGWQVLRQRERPATTVWTGLCPVPTSPTGKHLQPAVAKPTFIFSMLLTN